MNGAMSGCNYSVTRGFWSPCNMLQTPGAPLVRTFLASRNTAVVAYPCPAAGCILQVNTNLTAANWGNRRWTDKYRWQ
jgi:hypothetical protein